MIQVTERMITLAIESMPTIMRIARESRDPAQVLRTKNLLGLLPAAHWEDTKAALHIILGEAFDETALETAVAEIKQQLRWD